MGRYKLYAGLNGEFGGANYHSTEEFKDEEDANMAAYELACENYESYGGMHGLFNRGEFIQELEDSDELQTLSDDELEELISEEEENDRENWIDYYVEEETDENKDDND